MSENRETRIPTEYKVDDQELLLGFYKKLLWNRIVPRIPASIAPNTITIVGQVCGILAVVCAAGAISAGMPFLYLVSAFMLLGYLTCDNVDGAHARRTGQASPLGEFLDHGLDGIASGAVLITTCIALRVTGVPMVLLCALGAMGFLLIFWEQFRTGLLVIPKVSSTEGCTLLMVILIALAIVGDTAALQFSMESFNVVTGIMAVVLVGYAAAMAPPIIRAHQAGTSPLELIGPMAVAGSMVAFGALGADGIIPSIAVGVFASDIVCRMIVLRHRGQAGPLLTPFHYLIAAPLAFPLIAPAAWTVTGWSTISLIITVALYSTTLYRGGAEMISRHERAHAVSEAA